MGLFMDTMSYLVINTSVSMGDDLPTREVVSSEGVVKALAPISSLEGFFREIWGRDCRNVPLTQLAYHHIEVLKKSGTYDVFR
jgi:hypothetical protein